MGTLGFEPRSAGIFYHSYKAQRSKITGAGSDARLHYAPDNEEKWIILFKGFLLKRLQITLTPSILVLHQIYILIHNFMYKVICMQVDLDEINYVTETKLTIRDSRRRTTVPKDIVDKLQLKNGSKIRWVLFKDNKIVITKVEK